ncbi:hypothetical protein [Azotobacter beijerinckii]|nr:hypothetical protein [Azotobacter beijerinckii]
MLDTQSIRFESLTRAVLGPILARKSTVKATVAGFGDPIRQRRTSAHHSTAGAFFVPAVQSYGGRAWETFGSAGFLCPRFANLRTAATYIRLATNRGSSSDKGASRMKHSHALNPSKLRALAHRRMALAALHADSSLSTRLARYNHHMTIVRSLEAGEVQHG